MKKYRKAGVGKAAANTVFNMFKGEWKVAEIEANFPAQKFWRKVIGEYTDGKFEEVRENSWDGPIQVFTNV
jgi:predicted acetyltransferase